MIGDIVQRNFFSAQKLGKVSIMNETRPVSAGGADTGFIRNEQHVRAIK
jgi:hypothetical protein